MDPHPKPSRGNPALRFPSELRSRVSPPHPLPDAPSRRLSRSLERQGAPHQLRPGGPRASSLLPSRPTARESPRPGRGRGEGFLLCTGAPRPAPRCSPAARPLPPPCAPESDRASERVWGLRHRPPPRAARSSPPAPLVAPPAGARGQLHFAPPAARKPASPRFLRLPRPGRAAAAGSPPLPQPAGPTGPRGADARGGCSVRPPFRPRARPSLAAPCAIPVPVSARRPHLLGHRSRSPSPRREGRAGASLIPRVAAAAPREPSPLGRVRQVSASLPSGAPPRSPPWARGARGHGGPGAGRAMEGGRGRAGGRHRAGQRGLPPQAPPGVSVAAAPPFVCAPLPALPRAGGRRQVGDGWLGRLLGAELL